MRIDWTELERDPDMMLDRVEAGETIVIQRDGIDIVRLEPVQPAAPPSYRVA